MFGTTEKFSSAIGIWWSILEKDNAIHKNHHIQPYLVESGTRHPISRRKRFPYTNRQKKAFQATTTWNKSRFLFPEENHWVLTKCPQFWQKKFFKIAKTLSVRTFTRIILNISIKVVSPAI
jgi:hypothetical protein